jgi:hypothetical protein
MRNLSVVGALPRDIQEKVPLLPTIARPITQPASRIQQRLHLWLDGFDRHLRSLVESDYDEALSKTQH